MDKCKYFGVRKLGMTSSMMLFIIGIILAILLIVIFFPATLKAGDFVYKFGCEGWTGLMNSIYDALGMPAATGIC